MFGASEATFECEIFSVLQLGGVAKYHDSKYKVAIEGSQENLFLD